MKKIFSAFLFLYIPLFVYSQSTASFSINSDIYYLQTLFPCNNNSQHEKEVYDFIRKRLSALFLQYSERSLDSIRGLHSFATNIEVDIQGQGESTIIYAIPVNNLRDNSFNIAAALSLCEKFSKTQPDKNVKILFLGEEFLPAVLDTNYSLYNQELVYEIATLSNDGGHIGTRIFLQEYFPEDTVSLLYINLNNYENIVEIGSVASSGQAPLWLVEQGTENAKKYNLNSYIDKRENTLYKAGYNSNTPIDLYMSNNIPALYITSAENYNKIFFFNQLAAVRQDNQPDNLVNFFASMSEGEAGTEWERNYIILTFGKSHWFINERYCILLIITLIIAVILFTLRLSTNFFRYSRKVFKDLWVIIWFFLLCFLFLFLATLTTELIIRLKGSPNLWIETPATLFFIKIFTTLIFFFSSLFFLQKIRLPSSGSFYSSGAILITVFNVFLFQFLNITLSFIAMWSLAWTIIFSFSENRLIKTFCLIISYFYIYDITRYIFLLPALNLCNVLIFSRVTGNLLITAALLPGILMILRILHVQTHIQSRKYKILRRVVYVATFIGGAALTINYYTIDIYRNKIMPALFVDTIDLDKEISTLSISSPIKKGAIEYNSKYFIDTGILTEVIDISEAPPDLVTIEQTLNWFMDRKNIVLKIMPQGNPDKVEIHFWLEENQIILDSNYQFTLNDNLDNGEFHIGNNPDLPLTLDILTDRNAAIWFTIKIIYTTPPFEFNLKGDNIFFNSYVLVRKSIYG